MITASPITRDRANSLLASSSNRSRRASGSATGQD
jgi:hypothetical protein